MPWSLLSLHRVYIIQDNGNNGASDSGNVQSCVPVSITAVKTSTILHHQEGMEW
jgi:hypothetical protein